MNLTIQIPLCKRKQTSKSTLICMYMFKDKNHTSFIQPALYINNLIDRIFVASYKINSQDDDYTINILNSISLKMNCICMLFGF